MAPAGIPPPGRRLGALGASLLPGAATIYFSFNAGGYFPGAVAAAVVTLVVLLVVLVTTADEPFAGLGRAGMLAAVALLLFGFWTLASVWWSNAPGRALIEWDRALLYALTFVFFAAVARGPGSVRAVLRSIAAGMVVVCVVGLLTRTIPDVFTSPGNLSNDRLSYPVSYWNALGLMAAIATLLCVHLCASLQERMWVRAAAAAAIPLTLGTLYFTFSRGAIVVGGVCLVLYVVIARPRGIVSAILAVAVPAGIGLSAAYGAELLSTFGPTSPAAATQGHEVALTLALCSVAAGVARVALWWLDRRVASVRRVGLTRRWATVAGGLVIAACLVIALAAGAPEAIERQYHRFVEGNKVQTLDLRERLTNPGNNGRIANWNVALDEFDARPMLGSGAGTYAITWVRERPLEYAVVDGHSLYLEVLSELGLVGGGLLLLLFGTILVAMIRRMRGEERALYAAALTAILLWAGQAGIDWMWELPAATLWVFALAGTALSRSPAQPGPEPPGRTLRVLVALGLLIAAVSPALMGLSQQKLNEAAKAITSGDCYRTIDASLASIDLLGSRPEPYELLAYCDARLGLGPLSIEMTRQAVERDPDNWEFRYDEAIVRGAAGQDPRPAVREAKRLNPRSSLVQRTLERFESTDDPREWERRARRARLLLHN